MIDWDDVDKRLAVATAFILTADEREEVARLEQTAFDGNLSRIREILEEHQSALRSRGFWTELHAKSEGLRFRYSFTGFYGPGGFASQFHVAGPLVLARINPKGDQYESFYPNDLDDNVFLGERFDEIAFHQFMGDDLISYMAPENQILSADQYRWIKDLLSGPTSG